MPFFFLPPPRSLALEFRPPRTDSCARCAQYTFMQIQYTCNRYYLCARGQTFLLKYCTSVAGRIFYRSPPRLPVSRPSRLRRGCWRRRHFTPTISRRCSRLIAIAVSPWITCSARRVSVDAFSRRGPIPWAFRTIRKRLTDVPRTEDMCSQARAAWTCIIRVLDV